MHGFAVQFSSASVRICMPLVVSTILALLGLVAPAQADVCGALRGQLASVAQGGGSGQRQIAALARLEVQRDCRSSGKGTFACQDLARRKSEVVKASSRSGNVADQRSSSIRAAMADKGCGVQKEPSKQRPAFAHALGVAARSMLYCVRLSDGYFFPAPNSQFGEANAEKQAMDQCSFICDSADVRLYRLPDQSLETETMVSVPEGRPYSELQTAFRYREDPNFKGCGHARYVERVDELRARTVTPADLSNARIPVPSPRVANGSDVTIVTHLPQPRDSRRVRVVGPEFLPAEGPALAFQQD